MDIHVSTCPVILLLETWNQFAGRGKEELKAEELWIVLCMHTNKEKKDKREQDQKSIRKGWPW